MGRVDSRWKVDSRRKVGSLQKVDTGHPWGGGTEAAAAGSPQAVRSPWAAESLTSGV